MQILCIAATPFEILPLIQFLDNKADKISKDQFRLKNIDIQILITGVGLMQTAFHLGQVIAKNETDLVLNLGVAGAFDRSLNPGEVVEVISERIGDLGAEDHNSDFLDLKNLGLLPENSVFDENGVMANPYSQPFSFLKKVNGMSVNKVHGSIDSIKMISDKYPDVQLESMEGAAVFYACLNEKIPFLEVRAISNYVEPRNKDNWQLSTAVDNLNEVAIDLIMSLLLKSH